MSARLTPLHRFAPHLHNLPTRDEASAIDLPIPLPAATITTPWPPRRGGAGFVLPSLDHLEAAVAAMDAGDRTHGEIQSSVIEEGRNDAFALGMRAGAERRSWYDIFAGFVLGACLATALVIGGVEAGIWHTRRTAEGPVAPSAPSTVTAPSRDPGTWADRT